jgi:hypothetical protein
MGRLLTLVCAAAALIVVASATSQVVVGSTAFRAIKIPAGAAKEVSVSCPAGYFALSGGASNAGEGISELEVRPLSARKFAFRLANAGDALARVTVSAACRRVRAGGGSAPYLRLVPKRRVTMTVPKAGLRQARFTCPSGMVPAATGFDLGRSALSVRQETQDLHTVNFAVSNTGAAPRRASLWAGCLTVVRPAGARATQLQVSLATDTVPLRSGSQVVTRLCPRGWLSLSAGYSLPATAVLNGAAAVGRTARWTLTNPQSKPVLADLQLACARLT